MTTSAISSHVNAIYNKVETFVNVHFVQIAYITSTVVLAYFSFGSFVMGAVTGAFLQRLLGSVDKGHKMEPIFAMIAMVGAIASLVALTPSGLAGGKVFQMIPIACSASIGANLLRIYGAKT